MEGLTITVQYIDCHEDKVVVKFLFILGRHKGEAML